MVDTTTGPPDRGDGADRGDGGPDAPGNAPAGSRRRRRLLIGGTVGLALLVAAGVAIWYFVFRDTAPPKVDLERATESVEDRGGGGALDGTWQIDTTIGTFTDYSSTFVGYRVQEELASIGAKTAFGRTPDVAGSLTLEGTQVTTTDIEVDMTTLQSDDSRRDGSLRRQSIESDTFPTSTFELTEPIDLEAVPAEGEVTDVDAVGRLTLHGVTKEVTIPLEATLQGDVIVVTGELPIVFADYDIDRPTAAVVLSVADEGVMELQLFFTRS